jgi:alpha-L-rhamnosidase
VTFARGHYDSMYGRIVSGWSLNGGTTVYSFSVPANTTATLRLRASRVKGVGKGARIVSRKDGVVVIELQSGNYKFTTR